MARSSRSLRMIFFLQGSSVSNEKARRLHCILVITNWFYVIMFIVSIGMVLTPYYLDYRTFPWVYVMRIAGYCLMGTSFLGMLFNSVFLRRWMYSEMHSDGPRPVRVNQVSVAAFSPGCQGYPPHYPTGQFGYPPTDPTYPPGQPAQMILPPSYSTVALRTAAAKAEPPPPYPGSRLS